MAELFEFVSLPRAGESTIEILTCLPLRERAVPHGFSLRSHGFGVRGRGPLHREELARSFGLARHAYMKQVHGAEVRSVAGPSPEPPECDGLTTASDGLGVVVQSADCVPLLFWDERANAAAAVHAGWRGTLRAGARAAVDELVTQGCDARDLHVAVGPAIRACCFEVGSDVVEAFELTGRDTTGLARPGPRGRQHLDLVEDNRRQLLDAGLSEGRVYDCGRCTVCENERFYSYRKEGARVGRLMGMVAPRPKA